MITPHNSGSLEQMSAQKAPIEGMLSSLHTVSFVVCPYMV